MIKEGVFMTGSIEKRGENSYRLVVSNGFGQGGKRNKFTITVKVDGKTEAERYKKAEKELAKFITEIEKNTFIENQKLTLKALAEKWIKEYAEKNLAPKTVSRYKTLLDTRIIPALGHLKIAKIKPMQLLEFYNNLTEEGIRLDTRFFPKKDFNDIISKSGLTMKDILTKSEVTRRTINNIAKGQNIQSSIAIKICEAINIDINILFDPVVKPGGLSATTIKHHHRLLHAIFETAVKWQLMYTNPAHNVTPPKTKKPEAKFLEEDDIEVLISALENVRKDEFKYKAGIYITLSTGVRLGELMGLLWSNIDFENNTIIIKQANQYLPTMGIFTKDTKNDTSYRKIILPEEVMDVITKYKLYQNEYRLAKGSLWADTGFVFTQNDGTAMHPSTIGKWFKKFQTINNFKVITFHQLRHTSASVLINEGINIKEVSKRLGHSNTSTTLEIYSHVLKSADQGASDAMGKVMFKNKESKVDEKV